jgi:hypothetical protein
MREIPNEYDEQTSSSSNPHESDAQSLLSGQIEQYSILSFEHTSQPSGMLTTDDTSSDWVRRTDIIVSQFQTSEGLTSQRSPTRIYSSSARRLESREHIHSSLGILAGSTSSIHRPAIQLRLFKQPINDGLLQQLRCPAK